MESLTPEPELENSQDPYQSFENTFLRRGPTFVRGNKKAPTKGLLSVVERDPFAALVFCLRFWTEQLSYQADDLLLLFGEHVVDLLPCSVDGPEGQSNARLWKTSLTAESA
jgi:hypothetical protein